MNVHRLTQAARSTLAAVVSAPVHAYRYTVSPLLPPSCRFHPSCSEFALEAIARHGPGRGLLLATGRLCRCHPWHPGGVDPVPDTLEPWWALRARPSGARCAGHPVEGD